MCLFSYLNIFKQYNYHLGLLLTLALMLKSIIIFLKKLNPSRGVSKIY